MRRSMPTGAPTAASTLLLGRADPLVAPATDYFGCPRTGAPDIGAIELGGCPPAATAPAPPASAAQSAARAGATAKSSSRTRARIVTLRTRRLARRLTVFVRCSNATRLVASLLARGRVVARASRGGTARAGTTFKLRAPRTGRVTLRIRAVGAGGSVTRTISIQALRR